MSTHIALFACGNFWNAQEAYSRLNGVISTEVGYTGGTSARPKYHSMGDHLQAIRITYDPRIIPFSELLDAFWKLHDPTEEQDVSRRSAIFYVDEHQKQEAESSKAAMQEHYALPILTSIEQASIFYEAEQYHQHYHAKLQGDHK